MHVLNLCCAHVETFGESRTPSRDASGKNGGKTTPKNATISRQSRRHAAPPLTSPTVRDSLGELVQGVVGSGSGLCFS
eukprot:237342-Amphidinium_carterae.3